MAVGGADVDVGTGAVLAVTGTTWDSMQLTDVQWTGATREAFNTSHMGTTNGASFGGHDFIPGDLADAGELTCTFHFDPDETPPLNAAVNTVRITWPLVGTDVTAAYWQATSCFLTSFEVNDPLEDVMTATGTWKIQGDVTITQSVAA